MEIAPAPATIPPTNMDCMLNLSAIVTVKGAAMFPRLDIASTTPVPVVLMADGNDSVVMREYNPKQNATITIRLLFAKRLTPIAMV